MFLPEWREFPSAPCLAGKKKTWWQLASPCCWNRARPWHASELVSFLVGLRVYQHPRYINCMHLVQNKKKNVTEKYSVFCSICSRNTSYVTLSQTLLSQTRSLLTAKQVWDATLKKRYERDSHTLPQSIERSLSCQKTVWFSLILASKSPRGWEFWKSLTFPKGSHFHPMKGMWPWHQARIPQEYPTATNRNNIHELLKKPQGPGLSGSKHADTKVPKELKSHFKLYESWRKPTRTSGKERVRN